jgi:hypothetical protein
MWILRTLEVLQASKQAACMLGCHVTATLFKPLLVEFVRASGTKIKFNGKHRTPYPFKMLPPQERTAHCPARTVVRNHVGNQSTIWNSHM